MTEQENIKKNFANMHAMARVSANFSQEDMADALDVSKKTIHNWESGNSSPSFFQSLEWFRVLSINPLPHYLKFINSFSYNNAKYEPDKRIHNEFKCLCDSLSEEDKRAILYVFLGDHGSSPIAVLQLALAYLHLPLKIRSSHTSTVIHDYNTEYNMGTLHNRNELPNMDILINAFKNANASILKRLENYNDL